jgi:predicted phosphodiesterase
MKIGVLADIHGDVANLTKAIDRLRREKVDVIVALGDLIYDRRNASETVELLKNCGAIGVWGNHELGLCVEPNDDVQNLLQPIRL